MSRAGSPPSRGRKDKEERKTTRKRSPSRSRSRSRSGSPPRRAAGGAGAGAAAAGGPARGGAGGRSPSPPPRARRGRRSPSRSRSRTPPRKSSAEREAIRRDKEEKKRLDEEEQKRKRLESSVFVSQIHPKVSERDLFDFFSMVGTVEDVKLIRDVRTGRSKGLCYVEFREKESLMKASALTNQLLMGYPITIQIVPPTAVTAATATSTASGEATKLYVGSLPFTVTEADLRPMFEAFGPIDFLDLQRESNGQSRGFGFCQFKKAADARNAMANLNGVDVLGRVMKVNLPDKADMGTSGGAGGVMSSSFGGGSFGGRGSGGEHMGSLLEEEEGGAPLTGQSRAQLMAKLSRGQALPGAPAAAPPPTAYMPPPPPTAAPAVPVMIQATTCVVVKNMFDPKTETEADFDLDIKEDVEAECGRLGKLLHVHVDKTSAGHVYIRFADKTGAEATCRAFNGRWFAGRQISAEYLSETTYRAKFPDTR